MQSVRISEFRGQYSILPPKLPRSRLEESHMTKKPSKKHSPALLKEAESDCDFATIAGYTSGGAPYGITWEEQSQLDHSTSTNDTPTPPEQKQPLSLNDLVQEMQIISVTTNAYFRRSSGEFIILTDEYVSAVESDKPFDNRPQWEQEVIRETAEVLACQDDGDLVPLPSSYDIHEYAIMECFCDTVDNLKIADNLFRSISGRGAFRRFKDTLRRYGIEQSWYRYRDQAYREIARDWCREHGISWRE